LGCCALAAAMGAKLPAPGNVQGAEAASAMRSAAEYDADFMAHGYAIEASFSTG